MLQLCKILVHRTSADFPNQLLVGLHTTHNGLAALALNHPDIFQFEKLIIRIISRYPTLVLLRVCSVILGIKLICYILIPRQSVQIRCDIDSKTFNLIRYRAIQPIQSFPSKIRIKHHGSHVVVFKHNGRCNSGCHDGNLFHCVPCR